jgi:hypothetical protein
MKKVILIAAASFIFVSQFAQAEEQKPDWLTKN